MNERGLSGSCQLDDVEDVAGSGDLWGKALHQIIIHVPTKQDEGQACLEYILSKGGEKKTQTYPDYDGETLPQPRTPQDSIST